MVDNKKGLIVSIFLLIFLTLLALNMYLYVFADVANTDYTPLTFTYFMQTLEEMPNMDVLFVNYNIIPKIVVDWGVFDFLKDFINLFTNLINIVCYICQLIFAILVWLETLLGKLFVGVFSGAI